VLALACVTPWSWPPSHGVGASDDEISVSLATVFILHSIALFLFPTIGATLHQAIPAVGVRPPALDVVLLIAISVLSRYALIRTL